CCVFPRRLKVYAAKRHKAERHETHSDKGDTQSAQAVGHITVLHFFANTGQRGNCERPTSTGTCTEHNALAEVVITLHHKQRSSHNGAIYGNQWQKYAERVIESRDVFIQYHFHNLHYRRNYTNVRNQTQETKVDVGQPSP